MPYILHVGGNQWYKNRAGLIESYAALVARMPAAPPLVIVGKPLTRELTGAIDAHSLQGRVFSVAAVDDDELAAAYSRAALSFSHLSSKASAGRSSRPWRAAAVSSRAIGRRCRR